MDGVEGRDLRSSGLRTPSGPEGSSGKEETGGAADSLARAGSPDSAGGAAIDEGVRGHPLDATENSMSYQTLYRKYRSQTFSDLVGQEAVSRALQGAIASDRVAHAYLFSGSRGTGKTTSARLLAKALNCLSRAAASSEPCDACESCRQITAGAALDLIEIDAASNRGIDEIRDLREKVRLAPALGRYKIYIIDEAHMLTTEAFNALLKTLEEPPPHVVFVLCTTESQKIPLTVLGRCQQFPFRRLSDTVVADRLGWIAGQEGVSVEAEALGLLARTADGSMRDAIGYLDQLVPLTAGKITLEEARSVLGIADPAVVASLFDAVLAGRAAEALSSLGALYEGGVELRPLVRGLMERCRDRLVAAIESRDGVARARLSACLDALLHLDGEVRRHAEPRFLVEATLVRLAVEAGEPTAVAAPAAAPAAPAPAQPAPTPEVVQAASAPRPVEVEVAVAAPTEVAAAAPAPEVEVAAGPPDENWKRLLEELPPSARGIFKQAQVAFEPGRIVLSYPYKGQYDVAAGKEADLQRLVGTYYGPEMKIELRLLPLSDRGAPTRPAAPEEHPVVQAAIKTLEGRVVRVRETSE